MGLLILVKRAYRKIYRTLSKASAGEGADFNRTNPLGGNGERVDIQMNENGGFDLLDIFQVNHWRRYEFATEIINKGDVCGDFACGTGYGSIMLSEKASAVTGADIDEVVISAISGRYLERKTVNFLNENLLDLSFKNHFDSIISFETLEHFDESNIQKLLSIFNNGLKNNGKLIFSTPYMQEQSEQAMKMGFHLTFYINEEKIRNWLEEAGFQLDIIKYQNYDTHIIMNELEKKDFLICVAHKRMINA